uniref:SwmB domain-containing protein n=1 Tax=Verminephrobacter aporrectodeae TaxID=1110389 RepID=UPI0002377785
VDGVANIVTNVSINGTSKDMILTLTTPIADGQRGVTVAYNDSTPADNKGIQDTAGNRLTSIPTTAVDILDRTPPVIHSATVTGNQLVLTYTEANTLDGAALTGNAGFTVNTAAGATAITVSSAVVSATAKTVTLTLSRAVANTETVTVSYTKPATGAVVQDAAGNDAASFSSQAVTNNTPAPADTTPPVLITTGQQGPRVNANLVYLSFHGTSDLKDGTAQPNGSDFTVLVDGQAATVTVTGYGSGKTMILRLSTSVQLGQTVTIAYQDSTPTNESAIQDTAGNRLLSFPTTAVRTDIVAPVLITTDETQRPRVNG